MKIQETAARVWSEAIPEGAPGICVRAVGMDVEVVATRVRVNRRVWCEWLRAGWLGRAEDDYYLVLRDVEVSA